MQSFFSESVTKYYNLLLEDKSLWIDGKEERRAEIHFALEMLGIADQRGNVEPTYERVLKMLKAGK